MKHKLADSARLKWLRAALFCLLAVVLPAHVLAASGYWVTNQTLEYFAALGSPTYGAWFSSENLAQAYAIRQSSVLVPPFLASQGTDESCDWTAFYFTAPTALQYPYTSLGSGSVYCTETSPSSSQGWNAFSSVFEWNCLAGNLVYEATPGTDSNGNFVAGCRSGNYILYSPQVPTLGSDQGIVKSGIATTPGAILPGSGNAYRTETDYEAADGRLKLARSYDSSDPTDSVFSTGWLHNFVSRRLLPLTMAVAANPSGSTTLIMGAVNNDPGQACAAGWASIVANHPELSAIAASYNSTNNTCQLSNGVALPVYNTVASAAYRSTTVSYGVALQRPDGGLYPFTCTAGICRSGSDVPFKLIASASGFTLTDEDDTVEQYNLIGALQSVTYRGGYRQTIATNPTGQIGSVSDSFGRTLTFTYNPSNTKQLTSIATPDGSIKYSYDQEGRLTGVTWLDATGTTLGQKQYQYNDVAHPFALTGVLDESQQTYAAIAYDDGSSATGGYAIASATGGLASSGGLGVLASSVNYHDPANPIVTDAFGVARTYHFTTINGRRKLTSISGAPCNNCNTPQSESFDSAGYFQSKNDWNGNLTAYVYDDVRGLEVLRTEAANDTSAAPVTRTITTQWDSAWRQPDLISEYSGGSSGGTPTGVLLRTTQLGYDGAGNLASKIVKDAKTGAARSWGMGTYTSWGAPQTLTGPRTDIPDTTQITYYTGGSASCTGNGCIASTCTASSCAVGQVYQITDPLGHTTSYTSYDGSGRPLTVTDANGVQTTLSYYPRGWLKTMTVGSNQSGGGRTTNFLYWPTGQIQQISYPNGTVRSFFYNAAHQLTDVYDLPVGSGGTASAGANHIEYTVDAMNNITGIQVLDAGGSLVQTHTRDYNTDNQLWHDYGALKTLEVTTYVTDNEGHVTQATDALNHITKLGYDALSRLQTVTDPNSNNTTYSRNALDQLTQVQDPRLLKTSYSPDALGDVAQIVSPDSGTAKNTLFDADGNATTSVDANGNTRKMQYDALDRLTQVLVYSPTNSLTDTIVLTYDQNDLCGEAGAVHGCGIGHLTQVTDSESGTTLNWTYDPWGQIIQKQELVNGVTLTTKWTYNATTGQLTRMTLPSAAYVGYSWGSGTTGGLVTGMTLNGKALVTRIGYFPFAGPIQWTLSQEGGAIDNRDYDADGRIDNDPLESIGYDKASRVSGWTLASKSASGQVNFGYQDPIDWVSSYGDGTTSLGYHYDANGNRNVATANGVKTTYKIDTASNRLTSTTKGTTTTQYRYDSDGSRNGMGAQSYGYDNNEQLTTVGTASYAFDGLGERVYKKATLVTLFNYDNQGQLIGEYTAAGKSNEETIHLGAMPVALLKGGPTGTLYYIHADYRNTPREIDNLAGQPVWAWTPQPFGENQPNNNPSGLGAFAYNLRYPGQYYDAESGLTYSYRRNYDAATGRYLQSDPTGLAGGINTYAYALNNPLALTEPSGLGGAPWHGLVPLAGLLQSGMDPDTAVDTAGVNAGFDFSPGPPHSR